MVQYAILMMLIMLYIKDISDKALINNDWYWYQKMDYNGQNPDTWMREKKAEIFTILKIIQMHIN